MAPIRRCHCSRGEGSNFWVIQFTSLLSNASCHFLGGGGDYLNYRQFGCSRITLMLKFEGSPRVIPHTFSKTFTLYITSQLNQKEICFLWLNFTCKVSYFSFFFISGIISTHTLIHTCVCLSWNNTLDTNNKKLCNNSGHKSTEYQPAFHNMAHLPPPIFFPSNVNGSSKVSFWGVIL